MGAWGVETFENDDAMDFAADLVEANSLEALAASFQAIAPGKYLESPDCSTALAAAEVVAALRGHPAKPLPKQLAAWIGTTALKVDQRLLEAARVAVGRIGAESELRELWQDSEEFDAWLQTVRDLEIRLGAA